MSDSVTRNRIICADGFSLSVQASKNNYCDPRENEGPYISAEVGFPSSYDIHLQPYAEDKSKPSDTVYGWVPAVVIRLCVESHGGIVSGEMPPFTPDSWKGDNLGVS